MKYLLPYNVIYMLYQKNFQDYINFLRDNINTLVTYHEKIGSNSYLYQVISKDLFDEDPFIVFNASLAAGAIFSNKNIYH